MTATTVPAEKTTNPVLKFLSHYLPVIVWLPVYQRAWLRADFIAGLTIVALLIPEGMAYAELAGVPPEAAFYAAPIGLLMFAIFGTSRHLVVAVSSAIATMSFATVSLLAIPNTPEFIALTAALAILTGIICILAGLLKLGRVAQFFSESVMVGFISGLAVLIMVKQLPKIFGIEGAHGNVWHRLYEFFIHLPETHLTTLIVGLVCLALLILLERYLPKIPAALVALVVGILLSIVFQVEGRGVEVVGKLPAGLTTPEWPSIDLKNWLSLVPGAFGLALVCFAEAIGPSRAFAAEHKYEIDANQEWIGVGASNFGAGLFQGFPIGASLSKSAANNEAGAHSQMSGVIAALVTAIVALFFTQFFYYLPEATLGAIVIVAVSHMVKIKQMRHLYKVRRVDFYLAVIALLAVCTIEILQALMLAVIISIFALVWHASQPKLAILGRIPKSMNFSNIRHHPENQTLSGLLMVRPENGLFFANASAIHEAIIEEVNACADPVKVVVIDMGATSDLDVSSADMLIKLHKELRQREVRFILTNMIMPVRQILERADAKSEIGVQDICVSPVQAFLDYLTPDYGDARAQEILHIGLLEANDVLQARMAVIPVERQATLAAILDIIDKEIKQIESG
jgi:high affinity sulfate transporter 1